MTYTRDPRDTDYGPHDVADAALERAVLAEMVGLNAPMRPEDPPYPASLMPIVKAVIAAVRNHERTSQ